MTETIPSQPSLKPPKFRSARTILALVLREMGSTYGASPGGYVWAILQPVGMVMLLSVGFSLVVRAPSLGTSFILFYATGYLPFVFYGDLATKIGATLRYGRALLAYPSVTWIDAMLGRFILNVLTNLAVFSIVIIGILIIAETRTILNAKPILIGLSLAALVGFGVGMCNAILSGIFPVWHNVWGIISRPLFLASAIFYIYEDLPSVAQNVLWWNPLVHVSGLVRSGFFPTYRPDYVSLPYCFGLALTLILLGLIFLRAYHTRALER